MEALGITRNHLEALESNWKEPQEKEALGSIIEYQEHLEALRRTRKHLEVLGTTR